MIPPGFLLIGLVFVVIAMVGVCTNWWTASRAVSVLEEQLQICGRCDRCVAAKDAWRRERAERRRQGT